MRILNITSEEEEEEEGIPDCFQSPPQTCFLFLSFFKIEIKRDKTTFYSSSSSGDAKLTDILLISYFPSTLHTTPVCPFLGSNGRRFSINLDFYLDSSQTR